MNIEQIPIRSIQHFLYCPHRWGLIEIGDVWAENMYVTKANIIHDRVHNSSNDYNNKYKNVYMSVNVYNDELEIYGVLDSLEISKDTISIIEYKPTLPKSKTYNFDDSMQLFAQKVCVDSMFNTNCKTFFYYADVKKRIEVDFSLQYEDYFKKLKNILFEIREYYKENKIPDIKSEQKCNGCSFKDVCIPKIKYPSDLEKHIKKSVEEI